MTYLLLSTLAYLFTPSCSSQFRMVRTKNVTPSGGEDDEDPPRPFRQIKGKTVYLEQQEGRKKRRLDRATCAALAAAAAVDQAKQGGQLWISSDHIAYGVRRLTYRPRSTAPPTPFDIVSTPPLTLPTPPTVSNTSTTLASTAPTPAPAFASPIPPPRFREHEEAEV